jgi:TolB protein
MKKILLALLLSITFSAFVGVSAAQDDTLLTGKIAFIGNDFNVYTYTTADEITTALTADAAISRSEFLSYRWPTWSTDGRLAFFAIEDSNEIAFTTTAFVSADGIEPPAEVYRGEGNMFNYAAWSPQNCPQSTDCRALSVLMNNIRGGGLFVELIYDQTSLPTETIGRGGPFYYSWSPDGSQMLWQRNNARLDIYTVEQREIDRELTTVPGFFQAPAWSPVSELWLVGKRAADNKTELVVVSGESERTLVDDLDGTVAFSWSPDGSQIAYVDRQGPMNVINALTGESVSQTVTGGVLSFFWSPDSQKIAFITLSTPPGSSVTQNGVLAAPNPQEQRQLAVAWSVLDLATGDVNRYEGFIPTAEMVYFFTYFDQFAQSHRVWSPDSRYLVYSDLLEDNAALIRVQDTQSVLPPFTIGEGVLGIWSH